MAEETERAVVKTYVPQYQKEAWREHADRLDMSQSEFVRSMVQAGRRGFDPDPGDGTAPEGSSADATPGGEPLEDRVQAILSRSGPLSWGELLDRLIGDTEDRLEAALSDLQERNLVQYQGRAGGYVLVDGADNAGGDRRRRERARAAGGQRPPDDRGRPDEDRRPEERRPGRRDDASRRDEGERPRRDRPGERSQNPEERSGRDGDHSDLARDRDRRDAEQSDREDRRERR